MNIEVDLPHLYCSLQTRSAETHAKKTGPFISVKRMLLTGTVYVAAAVAAGFVLGVAHAGAGALAE